MIVVVDNKNPFLADALSSCAEVRQLATTAITPDVLRDADAVVVRSETKVGPALLEGTRVQFVGTATIGTDHVDLEYLARRGIGFAAAPGSNATSVAEYVAAALLEAAARLGIPLRGRKLGVVGVGNVGSRVARVGRALGMIVLQNDPPLSRATGDPVYEPLDALMDADVITLHVPLTRDGPDPTFRLVDAHRLSRMKRGSILINTSRGAVVEPTALGNALASAHLGGAILDVWDGEPDVDAALIRQVMIGTPHIAGYSFDGKVNAARMMFEAIVRHFGLGCEWPLPANMPPPRVSRIQLPGEGSPSDIVRGAVGACYSIMQDDRLFRELIPMPGDARRAEFRRQRAAYPVRREFAATRITGVAGRTDIGTCLAMLGFTMDESPEAA